MRARVRPGRSPDAVRDVVGPLQSLLTKSSCRYARSAISDRELTHRWPIVGKQIAATLPLPAESRPRVLRVCSVSREVYD